MLNKDNVRELAYVVKIDWIAPIEGADNIELVGINGWTCIAKKGEFAEGDLAVYFEIDSKLPEDAEWASFMAPKKFKVKTMKLGKFKVISQGLALPASAFGWEMTTTGQFAGDAPIIKKSDGKYFAEGDFLTQELGVTYASEEDNKRKANTGDKYKKMAQRHPKLFQKKLIRWLYKRMWGKKLLFVFFGKKKDKKDAWPYWVVKTDEERVENMTWILKNKDTKWFATEKIDGTSTTFTLRRGKMGKKEFYVCSRNVVFDTPEKGCYYDTNVYVEMEEKYNMRGVLETLLSENPDLEFITLQGETYGEGIQKRTYGLKGHDFMAFNLIYGHKDGTTERFNPKMMARILTNFEVPCVPILAESYVLPDTIEELREFVNSEGSKVDGVIKEGIVFRNEDATQSFKCVSPEFLLKYHQ